jgi:hypothetical protein
VAVVNLHVYHYEIGLLLNLRWGGLNEKHVVATWNLGNHLSIRF